MHKRLSRMSVAVALAIGLFPLDVYAGGDWEYEMARELFQTGEYEQAALRLQEAVDKGHSAARLPLAAMYRDGTGVEQDPAKAIKLFTISAREGYPSAQFTLGAMYRAGEGAQVNYKLAKKWFMAAALQGDEGSQNNLGTMYEAGRGVQSSQVTALMWYEIAVVNGSERGSINYKRLKRKLSDDEIRKAKKWAQNCLQSRYRQCGDS